MNFVKERNNLSWGHFTVLNYTFPEYNISYQLALANGVPFLVLF